MTPASRVALSSGAGAIFGALVGGLLGLGGAAGALACGGCDRELAN